MNTQLLAEAKKLALNERIELVEAIWDSVALEATNLPVPDSHLALLDERLADFESNPREGASWDEVRSRLEKLD
jgi:putative addiction module component (TIGR02574 family)